MTVKRLIAISCIVACTAAAWFVLAETVNVRSASSSSRLTPEVEKNWGPVLKQEQPSLYYETPGEGRSRREIQPEQSNIQVAITYEPKNKGLFWYRTYFADFEAEYRVKNPAPIPQTIYVAFRFPAAEARYDKFSLIFGDKTTNKEPENGQLAESLQLAPGAEAPLKVTYRASGVDTWSYVLTGAKRIKNLHLAMTTNFREINVPVGAESPTSRAPDGRHYNWDYTDVIGAHAIAMDMPAVTNPGYVAGRMTFFAPVSLLFFFAVLVIVAVRDRIDLHPMNYFFLAAGCFAFQLLFAYLVDLVPLLASFLIAAVVSIALVNGYLWRAAGAKFARVAAVAQFAFMVLFSYSFFFDGLTGITITIGAIITLGLLMAFTARVNWSIALTSRATPPPIPVQS
jgi:hypothetical protein